MPTARDQFIQGLSSNASSGYNPWLLLQIFIGITTALLLLAAAMRWRDRLRAAKARPLHDPHKLTREMTRKLRLSSADLRKLNYHAGRLGVTQPLALLLCPSIADRGEEAAPEAPIPASPMS